MTHQTDLPLSGFCVLLDRSWFEYLHHHIALEPPTAAALVADLQMDNLLRQPPEKPMSVPEIIKRAEEFEYNPLVPLRYWLRTADTLLKEVRLSMLCRRL